MQNSILLSVDTVGIPILQQQLANFDIPDISGSTSIDVVGKIDYDLSRYGVLWYHYCIVTCL